MKDTILIKDLKKYLTPSQWNNFISLKNTKIIDARKLSLK